MTKKIKKLEKETIIWRTKWENNNKALLQMAEEVRRFPMVKVCVLSWGLVKLKHLTGQGACGVPTAVVEGSGQSRGWEDGSLEPAAVFEACRWGA